MSDIDTRKKILVAEDDDFLASAYSVKLGKQNYEVRIVKDGEATINALAEFSPDLLLLDLVMPKKDGFAVLQEMQTRGLTTKIPVLVTSNLGQAEDKTRALNLGARDYIVKSDSSLEDIVKKVAEMLK